MSLTEGLGLAARTTGSNSKLLSLTSVGRNLMDLLPEGQSLEMHVSLPDKKEVARSARPELLSW